MIAYAEPYRGNETVFGLDIRARDIPRAAAERARDTGEASATGKYRLAQEKGASYGLVLYQPVYLPGEHRTVDERRQTLRGFVNVVLRVDDIFGDLANDPVLHGMGMRIHDLGAADAPALEPGDATLFYRRRSCRWDRSLPHFWIHDAAQGLARHPLVVGRAPVAGAARRRAAAESLAHALPAAGTGRRPRDVDAALRRALRGVAHA